MTQTPASQAPGPGDTRLSCPGCGAAFDCGVRDGMGSCWCAGYPGLSGPERGVGCYCPGCLRERIQAERAAPGRLR
ncbi:MAG: cysteine-rich CWC family protein [Burkholderiales bacterium]